MNDIERYFGGRARREADVLYGQIVSRNTNGTYQVRRITDGIVVTASKSNINDEFSKGTWITMSYLGASKLAQGAGYMIQSRAPAEQKGLTGASIDDQDEVTVPLLDAVAPMPVPVKQGRTSAFFDVYGSGFLDGPKYDTSDLTTHALTIEPKHLRLKVAAALTTELGLHALVIGLQKIRDAIRVDEAPAGPPPPTVAYGLAYGGGANGFGSVWSFDFGTNAITVLYSFDSTDPVFSPLGKGVIVGDELYFMCASDGGSGYGGIAKFNLVTNALVLIQTFTGANGRYPAGNLLETGGFIYGCAFGGGTFSHGVIFKIDTADDSFALVHEFNVAADGRGPVSITLVGSMIYGVTQGGPGSSPDFYNGTIFSVDTASDSFALAYAYPVPTGFVSVSSFHPASVNYDGAGNLYVLCQSGFGSADTIGPSGGTNSGQIDKLEIATLTMTWALVFFNTSMPMGYGPVGLMTLADTGVFYGSAAHGGTNGNGGIFAFNPTLNVLDEYVVYDDLVNGGYPGASGTAPANSLFYIVTTAGGSGDNGSIGIIDPSGSPYVMVHEFTSAEGSYMDTALTLP